MTAPSDTNAVDLTPATQSLESSVDRFIPDTFVGKLEPNYFCRGWNSKRQKYCRVRAGRGTTHLGHGRCKHHGGTVPNDGRARHMTHGRRRRYGGRFAPRVRELVDHFAADPAPFDVRPELDVARALLTDYIERYEGFTEALAAWHDSWNGKTINATEASALRSVLDEYESLIRVEDPTFKQEADLQSARTALAFLATPRAEKPRAVLDLSDAIAHVDRISKVITRAEQLRQHGSISIERIRLFMLELDRVLELEISDHDHRERIRRALASVRV